MVNYVIESIAVGLYSLFIFYILSQTTTINSKTKATIMLFTTGFFKHLLGNLLQIHDYYCNNGSACSFLQLRENQPIPQTESHIKYISQNKTAMLIIECIMEGIIFVILYNMILYILNQQLAKQGQQSTNKQTRNNMTIVFLIGLIMHVLSEKTGVHTYFCKTRCNPQYNNK
jgi:hypothetical protein